MFRYVCIVFLTLLFGGISTVSAEENATVVSPDKDWRIGFNTPVTLESAEKAISVENAESGRNVSRDLSYGKNDSTIVVHPPEEGYTASDTYNILISKEIVSTSGVQAEQHFDKTFTVKEDPFATWHSVRTLDMGDETSIHLLADEPAPPLTDETGEWFDQYDATFKLGVDHTTGRKVMELPFSTDHTMSFLHNTRENIQTLFRKIDDRTFVYSERADASHTEDYVFNVTDGNVEPVTFSFEDGSTSDSILNILGKFKASGENTYLQSTYNNAIGETITTTYTWKEKTHTLVEKAALTEEEIEVQAARGYQNAHRIIYNDLQAVHNGEFEQRDFSRIEGRLEAFVTTDMMKNLEDSYASICVACDTLILSSEWAWDVHKNVLQNTEEKVIVETVEPANNLAGGGFETVTIVYENGAWKLDQVDYQSFDSNRHLNLSATDAGTLIEAYVNSEAVQYTGSSKGMVRIYNGDDYETTYYHFMYNGTEYKVDASTGKVEDVY